MANPQSSHLPDHSGSVESDKFAGNAPSASPELARAGLLKAISLAEARSGGNLPEPVKRELSALYAEAGNLSPEEAASFADHVARASVGFQLGCANAVSDRNRKLGELLEPAGDPSSKLLLS